MFDVPIQAVDAGNQDLRRAMRDIVSRYLLNVKPLIPLRWALTAGLVMAVGPSGAMASWTEWGGEGRDFAVAEGPALLADWPKDGPKVVFQRTLGAGYSAVLVDASRIYVGFHDGTTEKVAALDKRDGKTLWEKSIESTYNDEQALQFGKGPNATPLLAGGRLFAVSYGGRLYAFDPANGALHWHRDLTADFGTKALQFGYSIAPIAQGDSIIVAVGSETHGAVGLSMADGSVTWKSEPFEISYASPALIDAPGEEQLVFMTPTEVVGVRLGDGVVRWRFKHENRFKNNCAMPLWRAEDQTLFVTSQADAGSRVLRLVRDGASMRAEEVAAQPKIKMFHNNALRRGNMIYGASGAFLTAYDVDTDTIRWQERGYPEGRMVAGGDQVFVLDENGVLSLVNLSADGVAVRGQATVLEKPAWTPPTLVDGLLYLRDTKKLVVLDVRAPTAKAASSSSP